MTMQVNDKASCVCGSNWTRSFPTGTVQGSSWILPVLKDLEAFATEAGLDVTAAAVRDAHRQAVRDLRSH